MATLPVAGYDNEFVDSIPDTLSCPVCLLPFRDPHLVSCCGAKFCESCIGRVKAAGQPCPLCKQEFGTMLDRGDQRKVLNLKVRCSRHNDGCQWVGELRHVVHHEREEGDCPRLMSVHEEELCPQRPMDSGLEREMRKMEARLTAMETRLVTEKEQHEREIAAVKRETIEHAENVMAEQRRDLFTVKENMRKIKEEYNVMEEVMINVITISKTDEIVPLMRGILLIAHQVPIEFIMTQYSTHNKKNDHWCSPPFYTGPGGYKMSIRVDTYGNSIGAGTHVSVHVHLMKGEYDSTLTWPFRGGITIQLVNHSSVQDHCEWIVPFNDAAATFGSANRVTKGVRAVKSWGYDKFISHTEVESSTESSRYIVNDCLTFRVTKIVVESV